MPVAFTSHGYDTKPGEGVSETVWGFDFFPSIGSSTYGVRGAQDWKVTPVVGQDRTVSVSVGSGFGHGVVDRTLANDTLQLDPAVTSSRWDLVAVRRDWTPTGGVSKFVVVKGSAVLQIPSGRLLGPQVDDQPLWMVQVTAGRTDITGIVDVRTWVGDGGGIYAVSDLVRMYLDKLGTRVNINGVDWQRRLDGNGNEVWATLGASRGGTSAITTSAQYSTARIVFPDPFPEECTGASVTNTTTGVNAVIFKITKLDRTYIDIVAYKPDGNGIGAAGLFCTWTAAGR